MTETTEQYDQMAKRRHDPIAEFPCMEAKRGMGDANF